MCAFFGGVLAQELVKISGRYRPVRQFFNFHVMQVMPQRTPVFETGLGCVHASVCVCPSAYLCMDHPLPFSPATTI